MNDPAPWFDRRGPHRRADPEIADPEELRAWNEYLATCRGGAGIAWGENAYEETERLAWRRLRNQIAALNDQSAAAAMEDDFNALD